MSGHMTVVMGSDGKARQVLIQVMAARFLE